MKIPVLLLAACGALLIGCKDSDESKQTPPSRGAPPHMEPAHNTAPLNNPDRPIVESAGETPTAARDGGK